jgi:hypothetical protein
LEARDLIAKDVNGFSGVYLARTAHSNNMHKSLIKANISAKFYAYFLNVQYGPNKCRSLDPFAMMVL